MIALLWNRIKCFLGVHTWALVSYDPNPSSCGWVEYLKCNHCGRAAK